MAVLPQRFCALRDRAGCEQSTKDVTCVVYLHLMRLLYTRLALAAASPCRPTQL